MTFYSFRLSVCEATDRSFFQHYTGENVCVTLFFPRWTNHLLFFFLVSFFNIFYIWNSLILGFPVSLFSWVCCLSLQAQGLSLNMFHKIIIQGGPLKGTNFDRMAVWWTSVSGLFILEVCYKVIKRWICSLKLSLKAELYVRNGIRMYCILHTFFFFFNKNSM